MKTSSCVLLILGASLISAGIAGVYQAKLDKEEFQKRGLTLGQYSFEYGCYAENRALCSPLQDDFQRQACYEAGLAACPKFSLQFRDFLANGRK